MKTYQTFLLLLCLVVTGIISCKKSAAPLQTNKAKKLVLSATDLEQVSADNTFTFRLFKSLDSANRDGNNVFASPQSVSFALGMTSNGAAGQTLAAFQHTLNFSGLEQSEVNSYYNNLITNLPQIDAHTTLNIANSIWYRQGFTILSQFLQTDSNYFHAQIQALDFSNPSSVNTINSWVSSKTGGKIPVIMTSIPDSVVLYLVNAIYFKSTWNERFDATRTQPGAFYLADNSQVQVSLMNSNIDLNYYSDDAVCVYELPYSGGVYSMVIVMPAPWGSLSLNDVMHGISQGQWQTWIANLALRKNTGITMPKFKFSYDALLNSSLSKLGLAIAFGNNADFSLINAQTPLKISQVMHKAYVETDENGTTAAAATSVGLGITAAPAPLPPINHPFIFAIRETSSGLIVFAGRVNNPLLTGN